MPIDDKMLDDLLNTELDAKAPSSNDGITLDQEKDRSLKFACVGVGQAGGRLSEQWYKLGYAAVVLNTAVQDLKHIKIPDKKKMFLDLGLAGAGKDLGRGEEAITLYKDKIKEFLEAELLNDAEFIFLAISGGGGSGSGSVQPMIDLLSQFGRPLGVIYILPLNTDDPIAKKNSLTTLAKLAKLSKNNVINSLIIVDNSKIETILGNLPQEKFWETANEAIVKPIHMFNVLTHQASQFTSLDASDFGKLITTGDISLIGSYVVEKFDEETELAEAVIKSFASNMLAEGFDLSQARCGGAIIVGRKEALDKLTTSSINYMYHMISEQTNSASIYRGVYAADTHDENIHVYSWISGLGLPISRINALKEESALQVAKAEEKEKTRATIMDFNLGEQTANAANEIHKKIQQKHSAFNKLAGGIVDKRKK